MKEFRWYVQPFWHKARVCQTDRETDRRTDGIGVAYTRYSMYAVARKNRFVSLSLYVFTAWIKLGNSTWNSVILSYLILRKIVKIVATRGKILRQKMHQIRFRGRPRWGSLQRSQDPTNLGGGNLKLRHWFEYSNIKYPSNLTSTSYILSRACIFRPTVNFHCILWPRKYKFKDPRRSHDDKAVGANDVDHSWFSDVFVCENWDHSIIC